MISNIDVIRESVLFDDKWYVAFYCLKLKDRLEAAYHYDNYGWKLNYAPSPFFSSKKYLDVYYDVKNANMNPLVHYELHGKKEGRKIFSFVYDKL